MQIIDSNGYYKVVVNDRVKPQIEGIKLEKNPNVAADMSVQVVNLYYPKSQYSYDDVKKKLPEIIAKADDPNCPLCERVSGRIRERIERKGYKSSNQLTDGDKMAEDEDVEPYPWEIIGLSTKFREMRKKMRERMEKSRERFRRRKN